MTTNLKKIEPEADGVLKDGQMLRVPHTMMDSAQRQVAADIEQRTFVADEHRPRSAVLTDDQRNAAIERQKAADKKLSDAWKNPEPIYAGAYAPQGGPSNLLPAGGHNTSLRTTDPMTGHPPGAAANVVGAASVAELEAIQAANERRYAAKVSEAWRNPGPINQGTK